MRQYEMSSFYVYPDLPFVATERAAQAIAHSLSESGYAGELLPINEYRKTHEGRKKNIFVRPLPVHEFSSPRRWFRLPRWLRLGG